jgi:AcrR family transcriptional regulator
MARSRNPAFRDSLLKAATEIFGEQGLGASTASIAKRAGVSSGSLFVYFDSKAVLINELYVELKTEMARVATESMPSNLGPREQLQHMWNQWIAWSTTQPERRRALAHLGVAEDLSEESRIATRNAYGKIADLVRTIAEAGPMRAAPQALVLVVMSSITDAVIDDLLVTPDSTGQRSGLAFDAMWRALAG